MPRHCARWTQSTRTILPSGKTFTFVPGVSLLQAIHAACHVSITEGRKGKSRMARAENAKPDTIIGIGSKSRLACQVTRVTKPVTVALLGAP